MLTTCLLVHIWKFELLGKIFWCGDDWFLVEFEKNEKKRLEAEMEAYAKQLEKDTTREKEQQDRKLEQLNKRKEDMVKEKKQKMNVSGV